MLIQTCVPIEHCPVSSNMLQWHTFFAVEVFCTGNFFVFFNVVLHWELGCEYLVPSHPVRMCAATVCQVVRGRMWAVVPHTSVL